MRNYGDASSSRTVRQRRLVTQNFYLASEPG